MWHTGGNSAIYEWDDDGDSMEIPPNTGFQGYTLYPTTHTIVTRNQTHMYTIKTNIFNETTIICVSDRHKSVLGTMGYGIKAMSC